MLEGGRPTWPWPKPIKLACDGHVLQIIYMHDMSRIFKKNQNKSRKKKRKSHSALERKERKKKEKFLELGL